MRLPRRAIGTGLLLLVGVVLLFGSTTVGLVPIHKGHGISLVPDHCTKVSPLLKAGTVVFLPSQEVVFLLSTVAHWLNLTKDAFQEKILPEEHFRPPCL
ncbi:MAG: hypothetical protein D6778_09995 [Nitrospirae bacterium]|nr:MAG: hypothetical protein D6778_09995 [Nitrospirota bacterium]